MGKWFFLRRRPTIETLLIFIQTAQMVFGQSNGIPSVHYVIPAVVFSVFGFIVLVVICLCVRAKKRNEEILSREKQIAMQLRKNMINDIHGRPLSQEHHPTFQRSDLNYYQNANSHGNLGLNPYFERGTGKNLNEIKENEEVFYENCSVCLEKECNVILSCHHTFHLKCIANWFKRNKDCPNCRRPINQDEIKRYEI